MSKTDYNKHLINALPESATSDSPAYIKVSGQNITFEIQNGPVGESGRNGCDVTDIIRYTIALYRSFNSSTPCRENSMTITKLEEALHWQESRTKDRYNRGAKGSIGC